MTTTTLPHELAIQQAKANLALLLLSLGIPLAILASFSLMRATTFQPSATQVEPEGALFQPTPVPTSPWHSAPNVTPPQFNSGGGQSQSQPVPVPTAVEPWPTFDPNVPVVPDFIVVIPSSNDIQQSTSTSRGGYTTHSGLKGGN